MPKKKPEVVIPAQEKKTFKKHLLEMFIYTFPTLLIGGFFFVFLPGLKALATFVIVPVLFALFHKMGL
jgi:hypothetical protein